MMGGWEIVWTHQAAKDLDGLNPQNRRRAEETLDRLALTGQGDLKRLKGRSEEWRLRVGEYRIRLVYDFVARSILVLRVLPRAEIYER